MKALIYVQHLLGIGHAVRAAAIGRALRDRNVAVTLVTGNRLPDVIDTHGMTVVPLPAARAADVTFRVLLDEAGKPVDEAWQAARTKQLLHVFETEQPDILLTEFFPLGRRKFRFELIPLLEKARAQPDRPVIASAVRDILVAKDDPAIERWMADTALRYYDRLLVHGDPEFIRLDETFSFAGDLQHLIAYTGYVHGGAVAPQPPAGEGDDEIIVACGGGSVGETVLRAAVDAATAGPEDRRWRILAGRDLPQGLFDELAAKTAPNLILQHARPDFPNLLKRARLSVCQAGYNTVMDIMAAGTSGVLVPFAQARESEQTIRAAALERHGRMVMIAEDGLTGSSLAAAVDRAMKLPRRWPSREMNGAERSADILLSLAGDRKQN
ncbi:MAG TPA: glycosyltransferase [Afifellaceae bacterium]|nr:glycosyltransferase [Afifellaceae bacterium]